MFIDGVYCNQGCITRKPPCVTRLQKVVPKILCAFRAAPKKRDQSVQCSEKLSNFSNPVC